MGKRMSEAERQHLEHLLGLRGERFWNKLGVAKRFLTAIQTGQKDPSTPTNQDALDALIECLDALEARLELVEREVLPSESFIRGDDVPNKLT